MAALSDIIYALRGLQRFLPDTVRKRHVSDLVARKSQDVLLSNANAHLVCTYYYMHHNLS